MVHLTRTSLVLNPDSKETLSQKHGGVAACRELRRVIIYWSKLGLPHKLKAENNANEEKV